MMRGVAVAGLMVAACRGKPDVVPAPPPPYDVHWVRDAADLETLGLVGDEQAAAELGASISESLEGSDFALYTDPGTPVEGLPVIGGAAVVAVMRIGDGEEPSCATMTAFGAGGAGGGAGQDGFRVSTKGVCGGISVLHSLLELQLVAPDDVIADGKLEEDALARAQAPVADSMTLEVLARTHEAGGTGPCTILARTPGIATNSGGVALPNLLRQLAEAERDGQDCTLSVHSVGTDGRPTLWHFEHVKRVRRRGGSTIIETTNGLDQGTSTSTVPADPGTNTWTCTPGGSPPMTLTGTSRDDQRDNYLRSIPPVQHISAVCCPPRS